MGGLVGIEVTGGEARLAAGHNEGWIASSIITPPAGLRCDLVVLEVARPGNSTFEVSLLNASKESSKVGYANETIPGYDKVVATELSVQEVSPSDYPRVRIQVNLNADGANRPRLLGWSMYFAGVGEWREDFICTAKMSQDFNLNLTGGELSINQSSAKGGGVLYEPFPTAIMSSVQNQHQYLYSVVATSSGDGYEVGPTIGAKGTRGVDMEDFDKDGNYDIAAANNYLGGNPVDSSIYWGDTDGTWDLAETTDLETYNSHDAAAGDFNGDGWVDVVFTTWNDGGNRDTSVFLNNGAGDFDHNPSMAIVSNTRGWKVYAGDFNSDGFDDILFPYWNSGQTAIFFGGPDGPDATADITITTSNSLFAHIDDLDKDGNLDYIVTKGSDSKTKIYIGGSSGPDTTADYSLATNNPNSCSAGDLNADGYIDVLVGDDNNLIIYKGTSQGWSDADKHTIAMGGYTHSLAVLDVNIDGFEDIVAVTSEGNFILYYGSNDWPTSPAFQHDFGNGLDDIALAVPKGVSRSYSSGQFVTEQIKRPLDSNWDLLHIDGTRPPGTEFNLQILDDEKRVIPGYEEVTDWDVDLTPLNDRRVIHLRARLASDSNSTTPTLDSVLVNWQDRMSWREQFYSDLKMEGILGMQARDHRLESDPLAWTSPQLAFASLMGDSGMDTKSLAFFDAGGLDYGSRRPMVMDTKGASAIDVADANADGFTDIAFALHRTSDVNFKASSPLFLGSATGWASTPDHTFPTVGAMDVLLEDLNGDGRTDVVFAQEQDAGDYIMNSTLFWGSASGWNATPDVAFSTSGASDVEAVDINGDGLLDLVFACFKDTMTSTESMVFLQSPSGFDGASPSHELPTRGARAVAAGDLDGDGRVDLVFANSMSGGQAEIESYVYWGTASGFDATPTELPTIGAEDVKVADLDGDGHLDIVFANSMDNNKQRSVDSYVYLNDGSGGFGTGPHATLPTTGAMAVAAADLDGAGWMDLVFACQYNGTSFSTPSCVYLGGASSWSSAPDIELPTEGASDVEVAQLVRSGLGGYISKPITPGLSDDPGHYHTFRYTAIVDPSHSATLQFLDATTREVLAEADLLSGTNELLMGELCNASCKEHPSILVAIIGEGLDQPGTFEVDDLWLNWTKRVRLPPEVRGITVSEPTVHRLNTVRLSIDVTDEYDVASELLVTVQHRLNGTDDWSIGLMGFRTFRDGIWSMDFAPRVDTVTGHYDLRVLVRDTDRLETGWVEYPNMLEVLNNLPTAPEIRMLPARPDTTSTLRVEFVRGAQDVEGTPLTYTYMWYLDGVLQPLLVIDSVDPSLTGKGQNWSVRVFASDGEDEGPAATVWHVIQNALPRKGLDLPDPAIQEDTVDTEWLDLSTAFEDPDGDALTWSVQVPPDHLTVEIDPVTGKVTLTPEANWNGQEDITFVASDGEDAVSQTVTVHVTAVNDVPWFATVNGEPVGEGPVEMTIKQGQLLSIDVLVLDAEGDDLVYDLNTTLFTIDGSTGSIRWQPENDAVGTLRFRLTVWDTVTPPAKVTLDFIVEVENENDPMDDPRITAPSDGARFDEGILFSLIAVCTDPDTRYGQVLNYSWSSNMSGHLGYGPSLNLALGDVGTHVITLTVTDGEFQRMTTVTVVIRARADVTPPPDGDGDGGEDEPINYALVAGIVAVLVVIGVLFFVARTRKKAEELETADEDEYKREHMERAYEAVKAAADRMEAEREGADVTADKPSPKLEDVVVEVKGDAMKEGLLSMEARETEAASAQTMALFGAGAEPAMSGEEQEQLRLDNLKRKYQNAIGRLPYGIPSPELKDRDWVELAAALATGEKKTTPGGRELTMIDGTWYYSDVKDMGTFLKEYGTKAKPKAAEKKEVAVTTEKAVLLAKLEERFILGEISEEAYNKLVEKYSEE